MEEAPRISRLFHDAKRKDKPVAGAVNESQRVVMMQAVPRIDCHAHIYTSSMELAEDAWHAPAGSACAADFVAALDTAGMTHGVLAAASIFGDNNDYALAETSRRGNLRTTVIVPPSMHFRQLLRMQESGAVGVRLQLRNKPIPDLRSDGYGRLLKTVRDLGWHIELHDDLSRIPPVLQELEAAQVNVVIDHFARPASAQDVASAEFAAVLAAIERGRTWVKVSAGFRLPSMEVARLATERLLTVARTDRLLWGSDWPFVGFESSVSYAETVEQYEALIPDSGLREAINLTGLRLYFPELGI